MAYRTAAILLLLAAAGCLPLRSAADRMYVSSHVEQRTGVSLGPESPIDKLIVPACLTEGGVIPEDQAVLVALWNNPQFQEQLVDLKLTRADLVQANLLPNPEAVYFWPEPAKPFKYAFELPIEAWWLRPIRVKAAAQENDRTAERLTQAALDLIRDTRQAYADLQLARSRLAIAKESAKVRGDIANMAKKRLEAGDASVQEASTALTDSLLAEQDLVRIGYEVPLAEVRLKTLLGIAGIPVAITPDDLPLPMNEFNVDELAADAVRTRPDAVAAEHFTAAAAERLRLQKLVWFRVLGILDATSGRKTGHEFGPAVRFTLPIFNWNQGNISRAQGELEQAQRRQSTLRNQIELDVRQAYFRYRQAAAELKVLVEKTLPEVNASIKRAEKAYKDGAASYLIVLETTRQLFDTNYRQAQLQADLRRAWAELERSTGHRLPR